MKKVLTAVAILAVGSAALAAPTTVDSINATVDEDNYFIGDVGIGTTSPSWALHVVDATAIVQIQASAAGAHGFVLKDSSQQWNFLSGSSSADFTIRDVTAAVDAMTLHSGGNVSFGGWISGDGSDDGIAISAANNVGVGTASPSQKLHVLASSSVLLLEASGEGANGFAFKDASQQWNFISANSSADFKIRDVTTGVDVMYVQKGGNIGLGGNTSPQETLHVAGTGRFDDGITYVAPLGDLSMGSFTNMP